MNPRLESARLRAVARRWWRTVAIGGGILVVAGLAFSANPSDTPFTRVPAGSPAAVGPGRPTAPVVSATPWLAPSPDPTPAATAVPSAAPATTVTSGSRPDPYVRSFAQQPGATPLPPQSSPTAGVTLPVTVNGCDNNYGRVGQCVPVEFPGGVTNKCAWLAERGLAPLSVVGEDWQGLDPDGDGIACEPEDVAG